MHGTPCFRGSRVPVESLFDWLPHGHSLDYFLEQFPTVTRERAVEVLHMAERLIGSTQPQVPAPEPSAA